jgi:putative phosphoesterase
VIAIVGDTHLPRGSRALPARCVELLREASLVLHVGDLTAASLLEELRALAPVEAVHGNMDEWPLQELLPERRVVEAENLRIGLVHDAGPAAGRHERLRAAFPGCGLVAYGHTHLPEVTLDAGVWIVNPGSPTERRRAPGHTIAVVREGRPELVSV